MQPKIYSTIIISNHSTCVFSTLYPIISKSKNINYEVSDIFYTIYATDIQIAFEVKPLIIAGVTFTNIKQLCTK